jgi:NTP pyrophosphatase (non-canonical NTP hydrolase)
VTNILSDDYMDLINELHDHFAEHGDVTPQIQIMKLAEEVGEAVAAYIGAGGHNPRKGITHNMDDVAMELADVVIVAVLAIEMCGRDPNTVLAAQAKKTRLRLDDFNVQLNMPR